MTDSSEQSPDTQASAGRIPDPTRVKATVVAAILGVSPSTIHQLQLHGVLKPVEGKLFNLHQCVRAYVDYRLEQAGGGGKKKVKDRIEDEKLRKLRIDNDLREGLTVIRADAEAVFNEAMAVVGVGLESLAGRLAGQMIGIKDPAVAKSKIQVETRKIRKEASDKLLNLSAIQYVEAPAEDVASTDEATGKKKRVKSGKVLSGQRRRARERRLRQKASPS